MSETTYLYDGTLEGLLTAVFKSYEHREDPTDILDWHCAQLRLDQHVRTIETDMELAMRVRNGLLKHCTRETFEAVIYASLSDDADKGTAINRFIHYAMSANKHNCKRCNKADLCRSSCLLKKRNVFSELTHPLVSPLLDLERFVTNERHYMMQFIRFERLEGDVWFAKCKPKASVVPLIMDWFSERFNTQPFMIFDESHGIAGIYEGRDWELVKTDHLNVPAIIGDEQYIRTAWKVFYDTLAVESRFNPKLRRQNMPKRLWSNITEMQEILTGSALAPHGRRMR